MPEREKIEISGSVESVTFRNEETGFTVIEVAADGELITAVGILPLVNAGEKVCITGYWDYHASFGRQFKAEMCERSLPETESDLHRYLSSGIIKGIGPSTATKIIEAFGADAFDVLEKHPEKLATIKGISEEKAKTICKSFTEQFAVREIMIKLEKFGMTSGECLSAFKLFGKRAVETVEQNPYILCNQGIGIGFERADAIADRLPFKPENDFRLRAGIIHVISHNLQNGHTCLPRDRIIKPCAEMLETNEDTIEIALDFLLEHRQLVSYEMDGRDFLFLPAVYLAEQSAARKLKMMMDFPPVGRDTLANDIDIIEKSFNIHYEAKQRLAIETAIKKGLLILTGGPGTGKTTTLNGILKIFEQDGLEVSLCAPTGRAAKRMSEVTGREAVTIHRLLEVEWDENDRQTFKRNERNPLSCNALIVDELSMVDVTLFASLLEALPIGCRLIMVGDSNQLPPVGAGNVLQDMIRAKILPVVELKEIFRQAMQSLIVTNAHKIVNGEMPVLDVKNNDFFFMERNSGTAVVRTITELCATRLPAAYDYSVFSHIQVICPSRKGETGTVNINKMLQEALNPRDGIKNEIVIAGKLFREGDKVMQIKNNYDIPWTRDDGEEESSGIFNGDIGILKEIDQTCSEMLIQFDEKQAVYNFEWAAELELAYAVTVHKSQGNEFEAVIMPMWGVVSQLAYRNLLYTGVTRAKSKMIMVGNKNQVANMVNNDKKSKRYSALYNMLI